MIPAEGCDAIAGLHAELFERGAELSCANDELTVRGTMERAVGQARYDLLARMVLFRAANERGDGELEVHHQAVHGAVPVGGGEIMVRARGGVNGGERRTPRQRRCRAAC
jgi:hypothetical protein